MNNLRLKINTFFYSLKNSLSNTSYYLDIVQTKLTFTINYFIGVCILASVIGSFGIITVTLPPVKNTVQDYITRIREMYPNDLVITIAEEKVSINQEEPYFIPLEGSPFEYDASVVEDEAFKSLENLVVFDSDGEIQDLFDYKSIVLVNQNNIIMLQEGGRTESTPLSGAPDTKINKQFFNEQISKVESFVLTSLYPAAGVLSFILLLGLFIVVRGSTAALNGLLVWAVALVVKSPFDLKQTVQISFHVATVTLLAEALIVGLVPSAQTSIPPFSYMFANFILGAAVVISLSKAINTPLEGESA